MVNLKTIYKNYSLFIIASLLLQLSCTSDVFDNKNDLADRFLEDFGQNQNHIEFIQYKARRIDSLISGNIRDYSGIVTLGRDPGDSLMEISFLAKRDSSNWMDHYARNTYYEVATLFKAYRKEKNYHDLVLGTPGGQLVIRDLLNLGIEGYKIEDFITKNDVALIQFVKETEMVRITKSLAIDSISMLPHKVRYVVENIHAGLKSSTTYFIGDPKINNEITQNELSQLNLESGYASSESFKKRTPEQLIGSTIPDLTLTTFDNKKIQLNDLKNNIILLDFWEHWCGPCIGSLPKVQKIFQDYSPYGLFVIGIATDNIEIAKKYIKGKGYSITQVVGNEKIKSTFDITSYPRYILIDHSGQIFNIYYGFSEKIELDINCLALRQTGNEI